MTAEAWFTLAVVAVTIVVLAKEWFPPSVAMTGAMVSVLTAQVVTPAEAFAGFSNPAPISVAALYVVARAVERTGILDPVVRATLGVTTTARSALGRLVTSATLTSGVLYNTPIVAMLTPPVEQWSSRRGWPASRFLMPLSFAAIVGGSLTLVGTSTNVVVSGLLESVGLEGFGFFEIGRLGIVHAAVGAAGLILLAPRLLPDRAAPRDLDTRPDFSIVLEVAPDGPIAGRSVGEAGLRDLPGAFLAEVMRDDESRPVGPAFVLHGGDELRFVGRADSMADLVSRPGLLPAEKQATKLDSDRVAYFEVVIGANSGLVGKSLRQLEFRSRYQAAVLAIHRSGERLDAQLGRVPLRVGDNLLVVADVGFRDRWHDQPDFLLIFPLAAQPARTVNRGFRLAVLAAAVIAVGVALGLPVVTITLLLALGIVLARILTPGEARRSVGMDVVVTIAAAFGVANAITNSGLADGLAQLSVAAFGASATGMLIGIVLATTLLKELIATNAAALLMFPLAIAAAGPVGADPRGFAVAVAVIAAKPLLNPVSYQTNTMVYGPGGYRYTDYLRLGLPITILLIVSTVVLVPVLWP